MKLRELKNLKFNFLGESAKNIIKIHKNSKIKGVINVFANNNEIFFGENVTGNYMISTSENSKLVISNGCAANGLNINLFTPSECIIGNLSLISFDGMNAHIRLVRSFLPRIFLCCDILFSFL